MPNINLNKTIKLGVFSGLFYAAGMALFDYADGTEFNWIKFCFNVLFFGGAMGWVLSRQKKEN